MASITRSSELFATSTCISSIQSAQRLKGLALVDLGVINTKSYKEFAALLKTYDKTVDHPLMVVCVYLGNGKVEAYQASKNDFSRVSQVATAHFKTPPHVFIINGSKLAALSSLQ